MEGDQGDCRRIVASICQRDLQRPSCCGQYEDLDGAAERILLDEQVTQRDPDDQSSKANQLSSG
ncbi:MAG: cbb3-type cytochrome oxidase assembly protein [Mesorhizobium sp.]